MLHPATDRRLSVGTVEVQAERMVAGGAALCRDVEGRVVLVDGALPGERVRVTTSRRRKTTFGELVEVIEAAEGRVAPPCPFVARGCGGCDWQHAMPDLQSDLRREIVSDALRRLGGLSDPVVRPGPPVPAERSRGQLRLAVVDGRLGLRRHRGHDVVPLDDCLVAQPNLAELLAPGVVDPGPATEVTLRVAAGTGERLAVAEPADARLRVPEDVAAGPGQCFHTEVAGHRLRVSAEAFFQARAAGAEALVEVVGAQVADAPDGPFVDLYGGVGLFAVTVAGERPVVVVERSKAAAADARHNLTGRDARGPGRAGRPLASDARRRGRRRPRPRRSGGGRRGQGGRHRRTPGGAGQL